MGHSIMTRWLLPTERLLSARCLTNIISYPHKDSARRQVLSPIILLIRNEAQKFNYRSSWQSRDFNSRLSNSKSPPEAERSSGECNRNKSSSELLLLLLNAYRLFVTGSQSTRPVFASLPRIRRVMLDLEGVERPATVCSSSKETRFAIAVTWEGAVVQLDPSPVTQGWLGLLSR